MTKRDLYFILLYFRIIVLYVIIVVSLEVPNCDHDCIMVRE